MTSKMLRKASLSSSTAADVNFHRVLQIAMEFQEHVPQIHNLGLLSAETISTPSRQACGVALEVLTLSTLTSPLQTLTLAFPETQHIGARMMTMES